MHPDSFCRRPFPRTARLRGGTRHGLGWLLALLVTGAGLARADDDDGHLVPPLDPGTGFEGILGRPPLPPYLSIDQSTSPYGVRQVFNTPQTIMGQSFTPSESALDWIAFVFQNNTQPGSTAAPGVLRARIYEFLDHRNGTLRGLLGESDEAIIAPDTTAWLVFSLPKAISVVPGRVYYCRLELVRGHPSWAGGRLQDFQPGGAAFGYLPNPFGGPAQNLNWSPYDLVFAQGSGRPPSGIPPARLMEWGARYRLDNLDERADPDGDGLPTLLEYLRDTDPVAPGDVQTTRIHVMEIAGARHLAWTMPSPSEMTYSERPDGGLAARMGSTLDIIAPAPDLGVSLTTTGRAIEVDPPVAEGLPLLSPSHRYRTFRLSEPIPALPRQFLVNRILLGSE